MPDEAVVCVLVLLSLTLPELSLPPPCAARMRSVAFGMRIDVVVVALEPVVALVGNNNDAIAGDPAALSVVALVVEPLARLFETGVVADIAVDDNDLPLLLNPDFGLPSTSSAVVA